MWPWRGCRHCGRSVSPLPSSLPSLETTWTNSSCVKKIWDACMHLLSHLKENLPLPCRALPCRLSNCVGCYMCMHWQWCLDVQTQLLGEFVKFEKLCGFRVRRPELGVWSFIPRTTITHISSTCREGERFKEKGMSVESHTYGDNGKSPRFSFTFG